MRDLFCLLSILLIFTRGGAVQAQTCPEAFYSFASQQEVDAFPPGCSEVSDGVQIGPSVDIVDLSVLAGLASVGDVLRIVGNEALTDLEGLSALTSVDGRLVLEENAVLVNVDALTSLSFAGELVISDNPALASLSGLSTLATVDEGMWIGDNSALTDLVGLSGIRSTEGRLNLSRNHRLRSLNGLDSLVSIGSLSIVRNASLISIGALSRLHSVGGVQVFGNDSLTDLNGLSALTIIGHALEIDGNDSLTNLDGLAGIESVGLISVTNNPVLAACSCGLYACVSGGCYSGTLFMVGNDLSGDCNRHGADLVDNACTVVSAEEPEHIEYSVSSNYPNPFFRTTTISFALKRLSEPVLTVYDVLGRQIGTFASGTTPPGTYEVSFDATGLPRGVYFYRLDTGDHVETNRMVVVR